MKVEVTRRWKVGNREDEGREGETQRASRGAG